MKQMIGKLGEDMAVEYLQKLGYAILFRNFRSRFGEIDIIAHDNCTTVYIEVRVKSSSNFGKAEESITKTKSRRLYKTALYHLSKFPSEDYRFDLIAINLFEDKPLQHYKNILEL